MILPSTATLRFVIAILILLGVMISELVCANGSAPKTERPNIALIVADDLRADVMSVYGGPVATPRLTELAKRGCLFTRATCGYPICHVSRSEILTGRSLVAEAAPGKAIEFDPAWALWPRVMQQAGWTTVYSGKWHVQGTPGSRGYDTTAALYSGGGSGGMPLTFPKTPTGRAVTGYTGWTFKTPENKVLIEHGIGLTPSTDSQIAKGAVEAITRQRKEPLFIHINFTAPHDPLHWPAGMEGRYTSDSISLPENFRDSHPFNHGNIHGRDEMIVPTPRTRKSVQAERAIYYALVENLDQQVGAILDAIDQSAEPWLIIFTSDQGLALGSHGLMGKQNQYEPTVNAPLIIAGAGVPGNQRIEANCALRDLFPTSCELASLPIPESVHGKSLVPLMSGRTSQLHNYVFGYFTDTQRMLRTEDGWKLIWYPQVPRTQLFHIPSDPHEMHDLANDPAQQMRLQMLTQSLQDWLRGRGDPALAKPLP